MISYFVSNSSFFGFSFIVVHNDFDMGKKKEDDRKRKTYEK